MIAPRLLPDKYQKWNVRWGAPNGRRLWTSRLARTWVPGGLRLRLGGPFSAQYNSPTRAFEYPWAVDALGDVHGATVLDLGGSLCGLQFVLDKAGADVINVDPGENAEGMGWPCTEASMQYLNHLFGTKVRLVNTTLEKAGLREESVDAVLCISVLEHIPAEGRPSLLQEIMRILRPGGKLICTVDLFLDLYPFSDEMQNKFGSNISIQELADLSGARVMEGIPDELYGLPGFAPKSVLAKLSGYLMGKYPVLSQCVVLAKPQNVPR